MGTSDDEDVVELGATEGLINVVTWGDEEESCKEKNEDREGCRIEDAEDWDTHGRGCEEEG